MVAASATATLNDINLSTFLGHPFRGPNFGNRANARALAGLTHVFLTASLNRTVSTPAEDLASLREGKEKLQTK